MSNFLKTALLGCSILAALGGAARADATHVLDKVTITGNSQVSSESLNAALHEQVGDKVSVADILADRDALSDVYKKANVGASLNPSMKTLSNGHIEVTFAFKEEAPPPPTAATLVNPKLHQEIFVGNVCMTSDELTTASGLKPGEELTNDKVVATQKLISDFYKSNANGTKDCGTNNVTIAGETRKNPDNTYDVVWTINEVKVKDKKKKKDDEGGVNVDQ